MNGSSNTGFVVLTLAAWADRDRTQNQIAQDINVAAQTVPGLRASASQPNSLRIRGAGNGLSMAMIGTNYAALTESTQKLLLAMEESGLFDTPRFENEPNQAQLSVSIDRERASDLGIDITGLSTAMQSLLEDAPLSMSSWMAMLFLCGCCRPRVRSTIRPIWKTSSSRPRTGGWCRCRSSHP